MSEPLFECAEEYEAFLNAGIRLSGEDRLFFVHGRVAHLVAHMPAGSRPERILDFGCGLGDTSRCLADAFPAATVVGVDEAVAALEWAREHHADARVSFAAVRDLDALGTFDLCWVSGVLHHVAPADRPGLLRRIRTRLRPGGLLAVFENNPWNPGARLVMRRIPFDRDAVPLSPRETRRLLAACGFRVLTTRSLFWFPRALASLRPLEAVLGVVPLGAQYAVVATCA